MEIDWTDEFDRFWLRLEAEARAGDSAAKRRLQLLDAEIAQLQDLEAVPTDDEPWLKRVRQSGDHPLWRLSHPFEEGIAVRVIAWFPEPDHAVVLLVTGQDKARMGDIWYDAVAPMADPAIRRYRRARARDAERE
jgi:hypothetical protein